jgi:predicted N-acetyltransferase YhbS
MSGYTLRSYRREVSHAPPISREVEGPLFDLLNQYGPHFAPLFGRSFREVLFAPPDDGVGDLMVLGAYAQNNAAAGDFAAHACVFVNRVSKVGLLGHVITSKDHQRQGLAGQLCELVLAELDREMPASLLILGTGSPHAAKLYQRHGFGHLAGGLAGGVKGYNPGTVIPVVVVVLPLTLTLTLTLALTLAQRTKGNG